MDNKHKFMENPENDLFIEICRGLNKDEFNLFNEIFILHEEYEFLNLEKENVVENITNKYNSDNKTDNNSNNDSNNNNSNNNKSNNNKSDNNSNSNNNNDKIKEKIQEEILFEFINIRKKKTLLSKKITLLKETSHFKEIYNKSQKNKE